MKPSIFVFCAVGLILPLQINAQGNINYLDTLTGQTAMGSNPVGSFSGGNGVVYVKFTTGTNPSGYTFNSLSLQFSAASGNPGGDLAILLEPDGSGNNIVFSSISGYLYSTDGGYRPTAAGVYTYALQGGRLPITLAANTPYWILVEGSLGGEYAWDYTTPSPSPTGDWSINSAFLFYNPGSTASAAGVPMFTLNASPIAPVPEPSALALVAIGVVSGRRLIRREIARCQNPKA